MRRNIVRFGLIGLFLVGAVLGERLGLIDAAGLLGGENTREAAEANHSSSDPSTPRSTKAIANRVCGTAFGPIPAEYKWLVDFAANQGLSYQQQFAATAITLFETGDLPECYRTKGEARDAGWSPGRSVWSAQSGIAIGGDRFGNREGRLPSAFNGRYREADLDYDGDRGRNADRLVFVQNARGRWEQWVTTDHYDSFTKVER